MEVLPPAHKSICGNCGSDFGYVPGRFIFCPVCHMSWDLVEWLKSPDKNSEIYRKYHPGREK